MRGKLRCRCGQTISIAEIVQVGVWLRGSGAVALHVRYRCPRCRRIGEQLLEQHQWRAMGMFVPAGEMSEWEWERFAALPSISSDDLIEAHRYLKHLRRLPTRTLQSPSRRPKRSKRQR